MCAFRLPLSGDVTQTMNPWNWFVNLFGNQFGLINIDLGKSSDPQLEEQILSDVGSYGRQSHSQFLGFQSLIFVRPSIIRGQRDELRLGERFALEGAGAPWCRRSSALVWLKVLRKR